MSERIAIIACGALARELQVLTAQLPHIELRCLSPLLHNRPERIAPAVQAAIAEARSDGLRVFVAYAECGTQGALDRVLASAGARRLPGPHCYAVFSGVAEFLADDERDMRSFFLTDFLARQFDTIVAAPLGLDRHPHLRDMYFGHYERVVHLVQQPDATLEAAGQRAAARLGLAYERRVTGFGDLAHAVAALA